jgi:hypothetical protein
MTEEMGLTVDSRRVLAWQLAVQNIIPEHHLCPAWLSILPR